jgi:hypothetical protein
MTEDYIAKLEASISALRRDCASGLQTHLIEQLESLKAENEVLKRIVGAPDMTGSQKSCNCPRYPCLIPD